MFTSGLYQQLNLAELCCCCCLVWGFVCLLHPSVRSVLVLDQDVSNSWSKTNFASCKLKMALIL